MKENVHTYVYVTMTGIKRTKYDLYCAGKKSGNFLRYFLIH